MTSVPEDQREYALRLKAVAGGVLAGELEFVEKNAFASGASVYPEPVIVQTEYFSFTVQAKADTGSDA